MRTNKEVNKQIKFEIKQGHCDQFFDKEVLDNVENGELEEERKGSGTEQYEEKDYEDVRKKSEDNNNTTGNEDSLKTT